MLQDVLIVSAEGKLQNAHTLGDQKCMSDLYHLAYISRSTLGEHEVAVRHEIEQILEAAKRKNPPEGITGALLYSGGYFCQLLEGPAAGLESLFETILSDDRHDRVEVLFFDPAPDRYFGAWAMAFAGYETTPRFKISGVKASQSDIHARSLGRNLVDALTRLVSEREQHIH